MLRKATIAVKHSDRTISVIAEISVLRIKLANNICYSPEQVLRSMYRITGQLDYPGPFFNFFFSLLYKMASTLKAAATQATKSTITPTRAFFRVSENIPSVAHAREIFKTLGSYGDMVEYKLLRVSGYSGLQA